MSEEQLTSVHGLWGSNEQQMTNNRQHQILAFMQRLQNEGYFMDHETVNMLLREDIDLSNFELVKSDHNDQQAFSNNNGSLELVDNAENGIDLHNGISQHSGDYNVLHSVNQNATDQIKVPSSTQNPMIGVMPITPEDDEFKFVREFVETEEETRLCSTVKSKPRATFNDAFINFLNGEEREILMEPCTAGATDNVIPESHDVKYTNSERPTKKRGRPRREDIKVEKRLKIEGDVDDGYVYENESEDDFSECPRSTQRKLANKKLEHSRDSAPRHTDARDVRDISYEEERDITKRFDHVKCLNNQALNNKNGEPPKRGRGRPRKIKAPDQHVALPPVQMPYPGKVLFTVPDDIDCYKIGDFVVERQNMFQKEMQTIYRINAKKMLQNYIPFLEDNVILHRPDTIYNFCEYDLRIRYKAVRVRQIKVIDEQTKFFQVSMPYEGREIENLENDPLFSVFNTYLYILLCKGLDETRLEQIRAGGFDEFLQPLIQIDNIISESLERLQPETSWKPDFREALDSLPYYKVSLMDGLAPNVQYDCNESYDQHLKANRVITFFGPHYDPDTLKFEKGYDEQIANTMRSDERNSKMYFINDLSIESIRIYHALKHFKLFLFVEGKYETYARLITHKGKMSVDDILNEVMNNKTWIYHHLMTFKELISRLGISVEVSD